MSDRLNHDHEHSDALVCRIAEAIITEIDTLRMAELEDLYDLGDLSFTNRTRVAHAAARRVMKIVDG